MPLHLGDAPSILAPDVIAREVHAHHVQVRAIGELQLRASVGLLGAGQQRIRRARIADQVEMIGTLLEAIDHHLVAAADLVDTLRYGLQFTTSGKPHRLASDLTTHLAAEMLVQHLQQSGFVLQPGLLRHCGGLAHMRNRRARPGWGLPGDHRQGLASTQR